MLLIVLHNYIKLKTNVVCFVLFCLFVCLFVCLFCFVLFFLLAVLLSVGCIHEPC